MNPNSLFHLSLRVNYPNPFDKAIAKKEGRVGLGSDIFIHGNTGSVGCLAMGDEVAEDLFVLSAETGFNNIKVILSPIDFRRRQLSEEELSNLPNLCIELYANIKVELNILSET